MKYVRFTTMMLTAVMVVLCGCERPEIQLRKASTFKTSKLAVTVDLPSLSYDRGDKMDVRVIVSNLTKKKMEVVSATRAVCKVKIWRQYVGEWDLVKTYPTSMILSPKVWQLDGGETRIFRMVVPVERDWPVGEELRVTAEMDGLDHGECGVVISVRRPGEGAK